MKRLFSISISILILFIFYQKSFSEQITFSINGGGPTDCGSNRIDRDARFQCENWIKNKNQQKEGKYLYILEDVRWDNGQRQDQQGPPWDRWHKCSYTATAKCVYRIDENYGHNDICHKGLQLAGQSDSIWCERKIPVCWENPTYDNEKYRIIAKRAVEETWAYYAPIDFFGWNKCTRDSQGIRVLIRATGEPSQALLGRYLNRVRNGIQLDISNANESSFKEIVVHEFGHALGFTHEDNRRDNQDPNCAKHQGTTGDLHITSQYDLYSVMNYCRPRDTALREYGREYAEKNWLLSRLDIEGLQKVYGYRNLSKANLPQLMPQPQQAIPPQTVPPQTNQAIQQQEEAKVQKFLQTQQQVTETYRSCLKRDPDWGENLNWTNYSLSYGVQAMRDQVCNSEQARAIQNIERQYRIDQQNLENSRKANEADAKAKLDYYNSQMDRLKEESQSKTEDANAAMERVMQKRREKR